MNALKIGIIGDEQAGYQKHAAITPALCHAADSLSAKIETSWIPSEFIFNLEDENRLGIFDAFLAAPQSPEYCRSLRGVLRGIRFARENNFPFLAVCGGFQNTVLEFAENKLEIAGAAHGGYNPEAADPVITTSSCAGRPASGEFQFSGQRKVSIKPDSRAYRIFGAAETVEEFACNYGLNKIYANKLEAGGFHIAGFGDAGDVSIIELEDHPFFLAASFLPQWNSAAEKPHPLFTACLKAALNDSIIGSSARNEIGKS